MAEEITESEKKKEDWMNSNQAIQIFGNFKEANCLK